jgi:predicted phosphohydrolase
MRIVVTADLHYKPSQRANYLAFAAYVAELAPDCFVLAGDVGHPLRLFRRGLELFEDLHCPRLLVAGNHDVYRGDFDSRTLWEAQLPAAAAEAGFVWLEDTVWRQGSVAVCGTMGWYDYSAASPHLPFGRDDYPHLKRLVNHDADYIDWPWSDRAMAGFLARRFTGRLAALEADPQVEQIVVVTHVPIFPPALPPYPQSEIYSLQRAYLGNFTLGELVQQHPKVRHVVSGHLHRDGKWRIAREGSAPANGAADAAPSVAPDIAFHLVGSETGRPAAVILEIGAGRA